MSDKSPPPDPAEPVEPTGDGVAAGGAETPRVTPPPPPPAAAPPPPPPPAAPQPPTQPVTPPTAPGGQYPPPPPPPPQTYEYAGAAYPQPFAQRVDVGGAVSWAVSKFGQNWQVLLVFAAVIMVINLINNQVSGAVDNRATGTDFQDSLAFLSLSVTALLITLALSLVALIAEFGLINASLKITRGEKANFSDFWDSRTGVTFVVVAILFGLAVGVGLVLCIIPGLLALWAYQFARFSAVDPGTSIGASFAESWRLVKANKGVGVMTLLIYAVGTIISFLTCGIGALVVQPVITLFMANVYRQLRGEPVAT